MSRPLYPKPLKPWQEAECRLSPHRCTITWQHEKPCLRPISVDSGLPRFGAEVVLRCGRHHVISYWDTEPLELVA